MDKQRNTVMGEDRAERPEPMTCSIQVAVSFEVPSPPQGGGVTDEYMP
jgi:hypothetical protein